MKRFIAFSSESGIDKKGKVKKVYKQENYMTPYEKLKSLTNYHLYLETGITVDELDKIAKSKTDNEIAKVVQDGRYKLFNKILPAYSS